MFPHFPFGTISSFGPGHAAGEKLVEGGLRTWLGGHGDYQQSATCNPLLLHLKTKQGYWERLPVEHIMLGIVNGTAYYRLGHP